MVLSNLLICKILLIGKLFIIVLMGMVICVCFIVLVLVVFGNLVIKVGIVYGRKYLMLIIFVYYIIIGLFLIDKKGK